MTYQALYRVFRPRNFVDLVGQDHVTKTIQNSLEQETFTHAYLFSGPRGTGKTSAAKIFAQAVNCEQGPTREPCQTCAACRGIIDGSIADVIEIDAASNTSVADIREIRDKVKYSTSTVSYKEYIIDEVHMISTNAFNALLKTLEEPPPHVIFILATTEAHKIPLTIISRCQRFDFKPIQQETIVARLKTVVQTENFSVTDEALEMIALVAEGAMRDALSILDQAISYSDDTVELADVLAITGSVEQETFVQIIDDIFNQRTKETLNILDRTLQQGKDAGRFIYDLIYFLRDMLLYKSDPTLTGIYERAMIDDDFIELSKDLSIEWIQQVIAKLNEVQQEIKWTNNPKIFIEIAILQLTGETTVEQSTVDQQQIDQLFQRINVLESELKALKKNPVQQELQRETKRPPKRRARLSKGSFTVAYEQINHVLPKAKKQYLQQIQTTWANFLNEVGQRNRPAQATIQDSEPVAASDAVLILGFKYNIHCELFLEHKQMVESMLSQKVGNPYTIITYPDEQWQQVRSDFIKNHEKTAETKQNDGKEPLIDEARKLVGDDLLRIHD